MYAGRRSGVLVIITNPKYFCRLTFFTYINLRGKTVSICPGPAHFCFVFLIFNCVTVLIPELSFTSHSICVLYNFFDNLKVYKTHLLFSYNLKKFLFFYYNFLFNTFFDSRTSSTISVNCNICQILYLFNDFSPATIRANG